MTKKINCLLVKPEEGVASTDAHSAQDFFSNFLRILVNDPIEHSKVLENYVRNSSCLLTADENFTLNVANSAYYLQQLAQKESEEIHLIIINLELDQLLKESHTRLDIGRQLRNVKAQLSSRLSQPFEQACAFVFMTDMYIELHVETMGSICVYIREWLQAESGITESVGLFYPSFYIVNSHLGQMVHYEWKNAYISERKVFSCLPKLLVAQGLSTNTQQQTILPASTGNVVVLPEAYIQAQVDSAEQNVTIMPARYVILGKNRDKTMRFMGGLYRGLTNQGISCQSSQDFTAQLNVTFAQAVSLLPMADNLIFGFNYSNVDFVVTWQLDTLPELPGFIQNLLLQFASLQIGSPKLKIILYVDMPIAPDFLNAFFSNPEFLPIISNVNDILKNGSWFIVGLGEQLLNLYSLTDSGCQPLSTMATLFNKSLLTSPPSLPLLKDHSDPSNIAGPVPASAPISSTAMQFLGVAFANTTPQLPPLPTEFCYAGGSSLDDLLTVVSEAAGGKKPSKAGDQQVWGQLMDYWNDDVFTQYDQVNELAKLEIIRTHYFFDDRESDTSQQVPLFLFPIIIPHDGVVNLEKVTADVKNVVFIFRDKSGFYWPIQPVDHHVMDNVLDFLQQFNLQREENRDLQTAVSFSMECDPPTNPVQHPGPPAGRLSPLRFFDTPLPADTDQAAALNATAKSPDDKSPPTKAIRR